MPYAVSFASFLGAISGQESGGSYSVVNSRSGALGKYQILPGNIGPWARQYLGISLTPTQFLHSPAMQERLATAVLKSYFNKYGARGAASAWYSGSPSKASNYTRFRSNEPSVGEYVDQVMARMGAGGGTPAYSHVSSHDTTATTDKRVKQSTWQDLFGDQQPSDSPVPAGVESADKSGALTAAPEAGTLTAAPTGGAGMEKVGEAPAMPTPQTVAHLGVPAAQAPSSTTWLSNRTGAKGLRAAFIDFGTKYLGVPYVWGGSSPRGFDCSGLIQYIMKHLGLNFPRVSQDQARMGPHVAISKLKPGDLVAFGNPAHHIAIYIGGGKILEAPRTGLDVRIRSLSSREGAYGVSLAGILGR